MADFDAQTWASELQRRGEEAERESVWETMARKQDADMNPFGSAEGSTKAADWLGRLPRNIGVGVLNSALAMGGLLDDIGSAISGQNLKVKDEKGNVSEATTGRPVARMTPEGIEKMPALPSFVLKPVTEWRDEVTRNDTLSDSLTQGIAQFVIPFSVFAKAANVSKARSFMSNAARLGAAEAGAVGTAFDPQEGRGADLLQLGREAENKFGAVMRDLTPDGSLINAYINYMVDREDESSWEGRFKNIVDSLGLSAATAGLLKAVPFSMKATRYAIENAGTGPAFGSRAAQGGWVGYHGTPHKVDKFDINKIGTGEGAQVYGHGLYFAEEKEVANTYRQKLTKRVRSKSNAMDTAMQYVEKHNGDTKAAYAELSKLASQGLDGRNLDAPMNFRAAADLIKSGNVNPRGELLTVEIPDEVVSKMIDFDTPISQQKHVLDQLPEADKASLQRLLDDYDQGDLEDLTGNQFQQLVGKAIEEDYLSPPGDAMSFDFDGNTRRYAAEYLDAVGIPGVRYLDGLSRKAGEGTRNVVLFNDKHVKITGKE